MNNEKKMRQLEAARNFGKALHDLRCAGVRQEYQQGRLMESVILIDRETDEKVAEFSTLEFLVDITGQIVDGFTVAKDYFGELVKEDSQSEAME